MSEITWVDYFDKDGIIGTESDTDLSEIYEEDEFEDEDFAPSINSKFPGWYLVRMYGFNWMTMGEVKEWCSGNTKFGSWEAVGWTTGCSSSVGVVFESPKDAMMFKLRWR